VCREREREKERERERESAGMHIFHQKAGGGEDGNLDVRVARAEIQSTISA
jgi:hypothetical protein